MQPIVIIGTGGLSREVAFLIDGINSAEKKWDILGFICERKQDIGKYNGKYPIIGDDEWLLGQSEELNVAIGIGFPVVLFNVYKKIKVNPNLKFPNLIFPNVSGDFERIKMGEGNIIHSGNIFTTDIEIGSFNYINLVCTVGHDVRIGNFNIINPAVNISGGVKIGDRNLIGVGAQILQFLEIGNDVIIGAAALVTKNIIEKGTFIGIPARKL